MRSPPAKREPHEFLELCGLIPSVPEGGRLPSVSHRHDSDAGDESPPSAAVPFPLFTPRNIHFTMPLVDARSPSEFARAHIPGAINIPLFTDQERGEVGIAYKQHGRQQAIDTGLDSVGPRLGEMSRALRHLCGGSRDIAVYCSRGGMRSSSVAWLMELIGLRPCILAGGYKSFRRYVLSRLAAPPRLLVLGGKTGSGKTETLHRLAAHGQQVVDLEGLARHRGSAFGSLPGNAQPTSEHFENLIAMALAQCDTGRPVWIEDECRNIGRVNLPPPFFARLQESALVVMETPMSARLERVMAEYGDLPPEAMVDGLDRIKKRLGGLAHKQAHACIQADDYQGLAAILLAYYDRAYTRHLQERPHLAEIDAHDAEHAAEGLRGLSFWGRGPCKGKSYPPQ